MFAFRLMWFVLFNARIFQPVMRNETRYVLVIRIFAIHVIAFTEISAYLRLTVIRRQQKDHFSVIYVSQRS